jgi:hypothetical protein
MVRIRRGRGGAAHGAAFHGYGRAVAIDDVGCVEHIWVLAEVGEGRGRLDIASTCSVCGMLNDETGPGAADAPAPW